MIWQLLFLLLLLGLNAFGANTGMPWEAPLIQIRQSVTGPIAYSLGTLGVVGGFGTMIWHGDMGEFGKRACMAGIAGGACCLAYPTITTLFGAAGAVI